MQMKRTVAAVLFVAAGVFLARACWETSATVEYHPPAERDLELVDDSIEDKNPRFDPDLVDSRPLGEWEVNASAAVIRLDSPPVKPDTEEKLLELRPSYADAAEAARKLGVEMLPSANLIDGKGKQFDDGLYAALDLASFRGELGFSPAAPALVRTIYDRLPAGSPARPFLGAALELAGERPPLDRAEAKEAKKLLEEFEEDEARSKPIGFYTWTRDLERVWRFFRFLQHEFDESSAAVPRAVAAVLRADPALLAEYRAVNAFYGRLTNPLICLPADLLEEGVSLDAAAARHGARRAAAAIFPPSTSRESELFEGLFPDGLPPSANLMNELIRRIRSGEVDLAPGNDGGWYQYQVHALETLLLPSRGEEQEKLLLTAHYKKRLVEAFKALLTKRRETHARQVWDGAATAAMPQPPSEVKPRLRLEPCVTFYLRTARAYAFLEDFLNAAVGRERLTKLRGLREGGERARDLAAELDGMRQLSYGLYVVACEDIGLRPHFLSGELVNEAGVKSYALSWLETCEADTDLALDTRVSIPIHHDPVRGVTRLWATLGVRLAKLEATYATSPEIRPRTGGEWQRADGIGGRMEPSNYVIAVDEFAEIELRGSASLTRKELRKVCDKRKTKERILEALARR